MVKLSQHQSPEYPTRTYYNVFWADVTIALAIDFSTAGERLTHSICVRSKRPILQLNLYDNAYQNIQSIVEFLEKYRPKIANFAGNSIHTFYKNGNTQDVVNLDVFHIINRVVDHYPIEKIISGGQTGVDWAAGVACNVLGIDCEMMFPKGYLQRDKHGVDFYQTNIRLRAELKKQSIELKKHLNK